MFYRLLTMNKVVYIIGNNFTHRNKKNENLIFHIEVSIIIDFYKPKKLNLETLFFIPAETWHETKTFISVTRAFQIKPFAAAANVMVE